jgi:hypothetical protein
LLLPWLLNTQDSETIQQIGGGSPIRKLLGSFELGFHCSTSLILKVDNRQFKFDIRTRMWASEHDNHDVEGAGLNIPVRVAAVHMEPSPSVLQVLIEVFATTIKICTLMRLLCLSFHQECTASEKLVQSVTSPTSNIKAVCDIELLLRVYVAKPAKLPLSQLGIPFYHIAKVAELSGCKA